MANEDSTLDLQQVFDAIQHQLDILSISGIRATLICTGPDGGLTQLDGRRKNGEVEYAIGCRGQSKVLN